MSSSALLHTHHHAAYNAVAHGNYKTTSTGISKPHLCVLISHKHSCSAGDISVFFTLLLP